uniref:THO complex subunit 7 homolog n=1 Tax=Cacopsylla melanoneura TaxID=428564 RepID=A0A8D8V920_9HEMI
MADEEVIRRRLLIDGDGTGDDRRLNLLLKSIVKYCNSPNDTAEDKQVSLDRMLLQLTQCEHAFEKSRLQLVMSHCELDNYETLAKHIETSIQGAWVEIEKTKEELEQAKTVRKNKCEYEVLAQVINEQPDRKQTKIELEERRKQHALLEAQDQQLNKKLEMRSKQFHVLLASIHEIEVLLAEDDSSFDLDDLDDVEMLPAM